MCFYLSLQIMYSFEEQNFIHPFIPSSKGSSRFIRETMIVFLGNNRINAEAGFLLWFLFIPQFRVHSMVYLIQDKTHTKEWTPKLLVLILLGALIWGEMCHYRGWCHLRVWLWTSHVRSGRPWMMPRGPCSGLWCWRPTGAWCRWVSETLLVTAKCRRYFYSLGNVQLFIKVNAT